MSTSQLSPSEIIAVDKKWPDDCMFKMNYEKARNNEKKDPQGTTFWMPFSVRRITDERSPPYLKAKNVILCSSAKVPQKKTIENADKLNIVFYHLSKKDLENTDYKPAMYDKILKSHNEFCDALFIMHKHLMKLYDQVAEDADADDAVFRIHDINKVSSFCQEYRNATTEDRKNKNLTCEKVDGKWKVKLDKPIFRLSVPVDKESRKLGKKWSDKPFKHVVFDARKSTKANNHANVPAAIKSDGKLKELTAKTAKHFLTYMSLSTLKVNFTGVCSSTQGRSCPTEFHTLSVWPHKPMIQKDLDEEDYDDMAAMGTSEYDDNVDVDELDEPDDEDSKSQNSTDNDRKGNKNNTKTVTTRKFKGIKLGKNETPLDDDVNLEPSEHEASDNDEANVYDEDQKETVDNSQGDFSDDEDEPKKKPSKKNNKKTITKGTNRLKSGKRRVKQPSDNDESEDE